MTTQPIQFQLNGRQVTARAGDSLLDVAQREGIAVPHLCHKPGLDAVGNCRACVVEVGGERVLAASCCRAPVAGMVVSTDSERAVRSQKLVLELLLADMPEQAHTRHNELDQWAEKMAIGKPRFAARERVANDLSHPAIAVNLDVCIQCTRCLRACRDEQVNDVIGLAFRPTNKSRPSAPIAASAANSPTTSRTTRSSSSKAATARPIKAVCASKAVMALTTRTIPSA
jgi:formate dehydrogenase major subunit